MRVLIGRMALVSALASAPAIAFAETQSGTPAEEEAPAAAESAGGTVATGAEPTIAPVEGQIILQSEDTILAKDLIGLPVYSPEGETVGDINDVIVSFGGTVEGVVIGVGGFLGIGEKPVAIALNKIGLDNGEGGMRLVLDATRDELKSAPVFKTALDQKLERDTDATMEQLEEGLPPADEAAD
ncbi:PRC-barrel domain-containing protein (plasmid) [Roseobacteraceae bacterium NS-SX3]